MTTGLLEAHPPHAEESAVPEINIKREAAEKAARFQRNWEERFSSLLVGRMHWKLLAAGQTVIIGLLVIAMWSLARQSHIEPYVIQMNGSQATYDGTLKPANLADPAWAQVHIQQLETFLSDWRGVTSDSVAQAKYWDNTFYFVSQGSAANAALSKWYQTPENNPFKRAEKQQTVSLQFNSAFADGPNTYNIWWTETTTNGSGQPEEVKKWQARIVFAQKLPTNEHARAVNPFGLLITELSWSPVQ